MRYNDRKLNKDKGHHIDFLAQTMPAMCQPPALPGQKNYLYLNEINTEFQ